MKSLVLQLGFLALQLSLLGSFVHAEEAHPCETVVKSCVAGGYPVGAAKEGKGAYHNCMHELIQGKKTIADLNLTLDQATVDACKAKPHPCLKIESACETAGFVAGGAKDKKGLVKDCMRPLMEGRSVAAVTVDNNDIQACKAMKNKHMQKRGHMKGAAPTTK